MLTAIIGQVLPPVDLIASIRGPVARRIYAPPLPSAPPNRQGVRHTLLIPSTHRCSDSFDWRDCPDRFDRSCFLLPLRDYSLSHLDYKTRAPRLLSHQSGQKLDANSTGTHYSQSHEAQHLHPFSV